MTAESVTIDEKGRLVLPKDARLRAGIKPRSKLLVEVTGPGVIELRDYDTLLKAVQKVAVRKLAGWKEKEHKEDKLFFKLLEESDNANC